MKNLKQSAASLLTGILMLVCVSALLLGVRAANQDAAEEDTLMNRHIAGCEWCSKEWTTLIDCPVASRVYSDRFHLSDYHNIYLKNKNRPPETIAE